MIDAERARESKAAAKIAAQRKKAAPGLGAAVQDHLRTLALPCGRGGAAYAVDGVLNLSSALAR